MTYSLGEVEALCRKATRGAGFSWGIAEDAAKTVRALSSWGLPAASALAEYLQSRSAEGAPEDPFLLDWSRDGPLCPLMCGTVLSDLGAPTGTLTMHNVAWPLLLMPFGLEDICIRWQGVQIYQSDGVRAIGETLVPFADRVTVTRGGDANVMPCPRRARVDIPSAALDALSHLAALTYAPETETRKLSGAGAGIKDAD